MDNIWQLRTGDKFKIVDAELLKRFPSLKNRELVVSVIKKSGKRIFIQYNSPQSGSGTLKLIRSNVKIKIIGKSKILTLSSFLIDNKYLRKGEKITLNINGRVEDFDIMDGFWNQNPKNIYAHKIEKYGREYRVPFSSIVIKVK